MCGMVINDARKQAAKRLGEQIRAERKRLGKTQQWVSEQAGVRRETIVQLEAGENVGMYVVTAAVTALGMQLGLGDRAAGAEPMRRSEALQLSRTYDWSSPDMPDDVLIRKVLAGECFEDVTRVVLHYGFDRVAGLFEKSRADDPIHRRIVARMLSNIQAGLQRAAA